MPHLQQLIRQLRRARVRTLRRWARLRPHQQCTAVAGAALLALSVPVAFAFPTIAVLMLVAAMVVAGAAYYRLVARPLDELRAALDDVGRRGDRSMPLRTHRRGPVASIERQVDALLRAAEADVRTADERASARVREDAQADAQATVEALTEMARAMAEGRFSDASGRDVEGASGEAVARVRAAAGMLQEIAAGIDATMKTMAAGDLTTRVPVAASGAWEMLQEDINRSIANVHVMLRNVDRTVESAAGTSSQIAMAVQHLASGSQEQVVQASQVSLAVEEMMRAVRANAENAQQTAEAAQHSGRVAKEGRTVVVQTVSKIRQLADVVGSSSETVERLGASSHQIGEIAQVIDEIADQTNLLALNAAIEAARAGEQGRGFAVVADEVRKLADRTSSATREITEMIAVIQQDTSRALAAMQRGTGEVEDGIRLADQAGEALDQIVADAQHTETMVSEMAAANDQQSAMTEQIAGSIQTIAAVSNESSQGMELITHSIDELDGLIQGLQRNAARFQTEKSEQEAHEAHEAGAHASGSYVHQGDGML